jgi:GNAT superfamily N-acetyltransferase
MDLQASKEAARATRAQDEEDYRFGAPPKDLPKHEPSPSGRAAQRAGVRIETINLGNKAQRKRFLDVADAIQAGDPNFISPLRIERMKFLDTTHNPALASLEMRVMIAVRDGRDVGRITAHIDRAYDAHHGVRAGWFGFFESIDDPQVAHALLADAVEWVKLRGACEMIGPNNFTTNHQCGLLVENFDRPPFVEMTYNPRYYERLITSFGFGKAKDLLAWWIDVTKGTDDPKMKRYYDISQKVQKRYGLRIRSVRMDDYAGEVARLFRLYNESWQKNWGFVPVTEPEFKTIASDLKPIIIDSLALIVEDKHGTPVAFSVSLPNINEIMPKNGRLFPFGWLKLLRGMKNTKYARLFAMGVVPGHRQHGVEAMLCIETALRAKRIGILGGEISWTLEDNVLVNRTVETFGGHLDRRYRMFGIDLT